MVPPTGTEKQELALAYQARLRALSVRLSDVREIERKKLAKNLHDQVGHELGLARIKLSEIILSGDHPVTPALREQLERVEAHLKQAVRQTRSLGYAYCPQVLYEAGFLPALEWLAEHYGKQNGIRIRVESNASAKNMEIPQHLRPKLFMAVRECVYNAYKYAEARGVLLRLTKQEDQGVVMEVCDDGKGFDVEILDHFDQQEGGFGLFSIREMIEHLGGEFFCISSPGQGTTIRMQLPPE